MEYEPITSDELIGRTVTIIECTDPSWVNRTGLIIDETQHTFLIENEKKQKRIAKQTATFAFEYHGKKTIVKGTRLVYRPEDRIKKQGEDIGRKKTSTRHRVECQTAQR
ncbi:MAG TPA: ribonuclease P protein subunit [Thermoplasmata archaeon]|jgi:ribonuclease P protein subunit POP4|nr:MAG TPA: ribonuclease P protein subunit [Thermoplasmata archaeon]